MSNLGAYQTMTTWSKRVGGPFNLAAIIAIGGYGLGKLGEFGFKKVKNFKNKKDKPIAVYSILSHSVSNEGLVFNIGDQIRILESDKEVVLIEKIGDLNNPYYVSADLLRSISNYK